MIVYPSNSNSVQGNKEPLNIPSISGRLPCVDDRSSTETAGFLRPSAVRAALSTPRSRLLVESKTLATRSRRPKNVCDIQRHLEFSATIRSSFSSHVQTKKRHAKRRRAYDSGVRPVVGIKRQASFGSLLVLFSLCSGDRSSGRAAWLMRPPLSDWIIAHPHRSLVEGDFLSVVSSSKGRPLLTTIYSESKFST